MALQTQTSKKSTAKKQSTSRSSSVVELAKKHQEAEGSFPDERQRMIAEAAYLIAEERNFHGDLAFDDWLQAEAEIDALFVEDH